MTKFEAVRNLFIWPKNASDVVLVRTIIVTKEIAALNIATIVYEASIEELLR